MLVLWRYHLRRHGRGNCTGKRDGDPGAYDEPVSTESIIQAIQMAQSTPSACNRQGWSVKIIVDKEILHNILANQNGNSPVVKCQYPERKKMWKT